MKGINNYKNIWCNKSLNFVVGILLIVLSSTILLMLQYMPAQATEGGNSTLNETASTSALGASGTAVTNVYLKADSEQLKFTAPSRIDFILDGLGNFTAPTETNFLNDSVMDIEISNYKVVSEEGCTGVEDADDAQYASQKDVYSVKVIPTHTTSTSNTEYSFSTSYNLNGDQNNEDWTITSAEKSIKLVFDKGRMPHPSRKWSDTAAKLQTVTWSVTTAS